MGTFNLIKMSINVTDKFPISKLSSETTVSRLMKSYGRRQCVIFSKSDSTYWDNGEWVDDSSLATIMSFKDAYSMAKDLGNNNIVFLIVKF